MSLGKRLMREAMAYVQEKEYREVFLLTTKDQQTAIVMYEKMDSKRCWRTRLKCGAAT